MLVKKKDGTYWFCVDYRKLNAVTRIEVYPLPRIDNYLDAFAGARYFTTLDIASGFGRSRWKKSQKCSGDLSEVNATSTSRSSHHDVHELY